MQAVLLSESLRGGVARGFRALAGAQLTFALLLVSLALGLSVAAPEGAVLMLLQVLGGLLLLWLAGDAIRSSGRRDVTTGSGALHPMIRGVLAIVLNPGAWLFLGVVASPLLATAAREGGTSGALFSATALVAGAAIGDLALVFLGHVAQRRGQRALRSVRLVLAAILAGLGIWLLATGVLP